MRKLWKTTATLAAAVLLAGSLAGCGSSGAPPALAAGEAAALPEEAKAAVLPI